MIPPERIDAEEIRYWIALHRAPSIGSLRFAALLARFGTPRAVIEAGPAEWSAAGLPEVAIGYLRNPDWRAVATDLRWLEGKGRHCLTRIHPEYPSLLTEIADPPALLYVEGDPGALARRHIAVVGSRNPTPAGERIARDWAEALVTAGFGIISGLAIGIDAAGQRGALAGRGITVAVSGTGPERVYPNRNRGLAEDILGAGGALVTEFPVGTAPRAVNFPRRNRIISGLSEGTLVVEAALRSGSLITARLAAEQNREVFAIPGSIDNPLARGCHRLIQEGAKLVQTVGEILEEFAMRSSALPQGVAPAMEGEATPLRAKILKCIAYAPTSVDTLVAATGSSAEAVCSGSWSWNFRAMSPLPPVEAICGSHEYRSRTPNRESPCMKENVFDVLIYLFENYMDSDVDLAPDPDLLRTELAEAGFPQPEITKAFEWLESLTDQQAIKPVSSPAFRAFSSQEMSKLDTECRGLLLFLEQCGILTPASRELVIDRIMAFRDESISLENIKWVILMVLFSQPNEEIAFARMEDLVYESLPTYLH